MTRLKRISGFSAYCATKDGRIWSRKTKRFLKSGLTRGYFYVNLQNNSEIRKKRIHRLVLETFVGPCPKGMEGCHNNGISTDNRLKNLRWDTHKNNYADALKHKTHISLYHNGETHPMAKLKEEDVRMIIYTHRTGLFSYKEIAELYNVNRTTISRIVNKRNWKRIWSIFRAKHI